MRQSHFEMSFIFGADSNVCGISLGYDRCAEHEFGIHALKSALGVSDADHPIGVEQRLVSNKSGQMDEFLLLTQGKITAKANKSSGKKTKTISYATLEWDRDRYIVDKSKPELPYQLTRRSWGADKDKEIDFSVLDTICSPERGGADPLISAKWDNKSFRVTVFGEARCKALESIYKAMLAGRVAVTLSGSTNPFAGSGLCLVDIDKLTEAEKSTIKTNDLARRQLEDDAQALAACLIGVVAQGLVQCIPGQRNENERSNCLAYEVLNCREMSVTQAITTFSRGTGDQMGKVEERLRSNQIEGSTPMIASLRSLVSRGLIDPRKAAVLAHNADDRAEFLRAGSASR